MSLKDFRLFETAYYPILLFTWEHKQDQGTPTKRPQTAAQMGCEEL